MRKAVRPIRTENEVFIIYIVGDCHLKLSLVFAISMQSCKMFCLDKLNVFACVELHMHAVCFYRIYTSAFL